MANPISDQRDAIRNIRTFPQLIKFLRDELEWPIESDDFEELTFDYTPEELGIDTASAAKIQEIKRLRPLSASQPWGIFFVKFEPKRLPVVALRRILSRVVLKKRASANSADRAAWQADDLLFISNYGEGTERQISFAHFSQDGEKADLPTLKVLGWDNRDTPLHLDDVAGTLHEKLAWPEDDKNAKRWREKWRSAFTLRHGEVITTSKDLAVRLADLARAIRARIQTVLAIETENGPITKLMKAFQQALIHDLTADDFADMYAQTIAYGLLSARVAHPAHDTADAVATHIPVTNPFLKELMETFLHLGGRKRKDRGGDGIDFDELGVSEVVELLDAANMEAVVRDFGDRNRDEDPVIHFYELFLKEYDAKKRLQRGVFYTPQPVVSYIIRSVHEVLQIEFGLEDGLASTVTWGEMFAKNTDLKIPDGARSDNPFVVILDPATGTATFLVEVIDVIYRTLTAKWEHQRLTDAQQRDAWNDYVPKHLLPRLHGFELMMAPYAIAHMKIGLKLYETGYRFGSDERARIYLTNALEPPSGDDKQMTFAQWVPALAHEARAVNTIKRDQCFSVVVGNPPYSFTSQNLEMSLRIWVEPYRSINGVPIKEKGALQAEKAIQDDYIKFMRFAEWQITSTASGIVGMISSHGYLDNPTLRGMRYSYLGSFDLISILDLHGNTTKKERCPDGSDDKNVFDIKQGVSIALAYRKQPHERSRNIHYAELWGSRELKYAALEKSSHSSRVWMEATPAEQFYLFKPHDSDLRKEFDSFHNITEMMPTYGIGCFTSKDHFVIGFDADELVNNARQFRDSNELNQALCESLSISMKDAWNVTKARALLRKEQHLELFVRPILYRPFDYRLIFYHPSLVWSMSRPTMRHMVDGQNVAFAIGRAGGAIDQGAWNIVICTNSITDLNLYRRGGNSVFPLYLKPEEDHKHGALNFAAPRTVNFSEEFLRSVSNVFSAKRTPTGLPAGLTPEDIFHYTYAVLHSPGYRSRYAEFLKIDFPRLPLTSKLELFRALARLGGELVALHLMESPKLDIPLTTYTGPANPGVEKISYARTTVWLDKAQTHGFRGVPEAVWLFHIGGYQVCEKWLKDRKGRTLSKDDIVHYHKIVVALSETLRLMKEIDEVIEKHGGWPGTFQNTSA